MSNLKKKPSLNGKKDLEQRRKEGAWKSIQSYLKTPSKDRSKHESLHHKHIRDNQRT